MSDFSHPDSAAHLDEAMKGIAMLFVLEAEMKLPHASLEWLAQMREVLANFRTLESPQVDEILGSWPERIEAAYQNLISHSESVKLIDQIADNLIANYRTYLRSTGNVRPSYGILQYDSKLELRQYPGFELLRNQVSRIIRNEPDNRSHVPMRQVLKNTITTDDLVWRAIYEFAVKSALWWVSHPRLLRNIR